MRAACLLLLALAGLVPPVASQPLTVTDAFNREVTIAAPPRRIVPIFASNTEIVAALGPVSFREGRVLRLEGDSVVFEYGRPDPGTGKRPQQTVARARVWRVGTPLEPTAGEALGAGEIEVAVPAGSRVADLRRRLDADHPALGMIALNLTANVFGLGNAATPFGIKAMEELQKLNPTQDTATNPMVMLLAINTASVQLMPPVLLLALLGLQVNQLIFPIIITTGLSLIIAIVAAKLYGRLPAVRASDPNRNPPPGPEPAAAPGT